MFAVVKTGGKQYTVSPGDLLTVERLEGETGQSVLLTSVLLINNEGQITTGVPFVAQAQVRAAIVEQTRGDKIIVFKKRRRQGYRRKAGHRQDLTILRIEEISAEGRSLKSVTAEPLVSQAKAPKAKESITEIVMYPKDTSVTAAVDVKKEKKIKVPRTSELSDMNILTSDNEGTSSPESTAQAAPKAEKKESVSKASLKTPKSETL